MSKKRKLFNELMEGVVSMRMQREGTMTLRTQDVKALPPLKVDAEIIRETRERLRVSPRTLENWGQGRAEPNAQAAALILMVRQYPDTLKRLGTLNTNNAAW